MKKINVRDGWDGISREGEGLAVTKSEGYGLDSPITAWAVELDGKIYTEDVLPTRAVARYIRNVEVQSEFVKSAHVRKVQIQVVKGR